MTAHQTFDGVLVWTGDAFLPMQFQETVLEAQLLHYGSRATQSRGRELTTWLSAHCLWLVLPDNMHRISGHRIGGVSFRCSSWSSE